MENLLFKRQLLEIHRYLIDSGENVYFDKLDDFVPDYSNNFHRRSKIKPENVTSAIYPLLTIQWKLLGKKTRKNEIHDIRGQFYEVQIDENIIAEENRYLP